MKVGNIKPLPFKSSPIITKQDKAVDSKPEIKELTAPVPDYNVSVPQKYTTLGIQKASNGLEIYSYKLANGHRVTIIPMEDSPAIVKNYVNVGSMNETDDIKGISHFLEHMAFNGTNGNEGYVKLNQGDSFQKIDELGGWTNASTNYALTDYVNSTPLLEKEDLKKQLQIIAAMTEDLTLAEKMIEKEKGPVSSEINMILDNPQTIVMDETVRALFNIRSSADELVGGSVNHIQNLDRNKVKDYYDRYYTPDNMNLVITGNVNPDETIRLISTLFKSNKKRQGRFYEEKITPIKNTVRKDFITDKASSTEIMLGFAGAKNNDTKSKILFEIISTYLDSSKTNLNKELKRLNTEAYIGTEKISTNPENPVLLYYTLNCADEKSEEALKIIFDIVSTLKAPSQKDLDKIKQRLIQSYKNGLEYSINVNDIAGKSIFDGSLDYLTDYENILENITTEDVQNYIDKYLDMNKAAVTLVHPPTTEEAITENHRKASGLSFKGRQPVNTQKIKSKTLDNNYEIAFQETKNDNVYFDLNLYYTLPNSKPAVREVLREILEQNLETDSFKSFEEDNNIVIDCGLNEDNLSLSGYSGKEKFDITSKRAVELLKNPEITQEYLDEAVSRIKDRLARYQDTAVGLYIDNEAKTNPLYSSKKDIADGLDSVTLEEVKDLYKSILDSSRGTISLNIPEGSNLKEESIYEFSGLDAVQPNKPEPANVYKENIKPVVLTKERTVSQADIMQTFKFELDNTPKEYAVGQIMNTLLSSSSTIGLFNTLREKEHLAYTVYSDIDIIGNCGEISLNILTTTDNKDIGEISYENVQKSIEGFSRQIKELLDSKYSDADLESAKRILKAGLLNKEGVPSKLNALNKGLNSHDGLEYENKVFEAIDSITREDIDRFAKKVFSTAPIYSIVASKDTLDANKDYLDSLKV